MRRNLYTLHTEMSVEFAGGCAATSIELEIDYTFTPSTPERGRFGPPENYDTGSPSEVEVQCVRGFITIKGKPTIEVDLPEWIKDLIDKDILLEDAMIVEASGRLDDERKEALDRREEDRCDDARMAR